MLKTGCLVAVIIGLLQSVGQALPASQRALEKIRFALSSLSTDGLTGAATGRRSISYEFCIPATETHLAEVQSLDPSVHHFLRSRGRVGCDRHQALCIGNTHQPHWQEILLKIASLEYVERIDQFWGE